MATFSLATEGTLDTAVARRLLTDQGHEVGPVYQRGGKTQLDPNLPGFNNAARFSPWFILRDLDHDAACPPDLLRQICPSPSEHLILRIPVREIETWLLADRAPLARFLGVPVGQIASDPENLDSPKRTLVQVGRRSRSQSIVRDLVPEDGVSAVVGPGYSARLSEFVFGNWDPVRASDRSYSLQRCLAAVASVR